MSHLDLLASAIKNLSEEDRKSLTEKLSASAPSKPKSLTFSQAMSAAAVIPGRMQELQMVKAMATRMNVLIDDHKVLSPVELNRQLAGQPVASRFEFKALLHRCGMLD
jgi:hypothetical protein